MKHKNIGMALSGGGIRAMLFHLGLFKWLAENNLMEKVKRISTVSGASLCVGMIYAHNNLGWPTSQQFLDVVLPSIEKALQVDLQRTSISKLIVSPTYWSKRVNVISKVLESSWGVHGRLSQLTGDTMWYINCTTFETGKRFRFCRENMGDYTIGYVEKPNIPLADVMAASAGFPVLIGPYMLKTSEYNWTPSKYSEDNFQLSKNHSLHLWDGGIYDNLGLESVFKLNKGGALSEGLDFLIISNASASIGLQNRNKRLSVQNMKRLLDISMDQVVSLRSRAVMAFIKETGQGMYVKIGNSAEKIAVASGCSEDLREHLIKQCLPTEQAINTMHYKTTLSKPDDSDIQMLLRHGYEVTNCTYRCYQNNKQEG